MNDKNTPIVMFLIGQVITAGGTYAAIRADLREALVTAVHAEKRAEDAHRRIEGIIYNRQP